MMLVGVFLTLASSGSLVAAEGNLSELGRLKYSAIADRLRELLSLECQ
jgi:hypothetical protein